MSIGVFFLGVLIRRPYCDSKDPNLQGEQITFKATETRKTEKHLGKRLKTGIAGNYLYEGAIEKGPYLGRDLNWEEER